MDLCRRHFYIDSELLSLFRKKKRLVEHELIDSLATPQFIKNFDIYNDSKHETQRPIQPSAPKTNLAAPALKSDINPGNGGMVPTGWKIPNGIAAQGAGWPKIHSP